MNSKVSKKTAVKQRKPEKEINSGARDLRRTTKNGEANNVVLIACAPAVSECVHSLLQQFGGRIVSLHFINNIL